jgi:hypothetical protein
MTESGKSETRTARTERLREALRENLKRRKAQARARRREEGTAGIAPEKPQG